MVVVGRGFNFKVRCGKSRENSESFAARSGSATKKGKFCQQLLPTHHSHRCCRAAPRPPPPRQPQLQAPNRSCCTWRRSTRLRRTPGYCTKTKQRRRPSISSTNRRCRWCRTTLTGGSHVRRLRDRPDAGSSTNVGIVGNSAIIRKLFTLKFLCFRAIVFRVFKFAKLVNSKKELGSNTYVPLGHIAYLLA